MNQRPCRRHAFWNGSCVLCSAVDEHRHCWQDIHWCAWYAPLQHDQPRGTRFW